jgi:rubrerythrin
LISDKQKSAVNKILEILKNPKVNTPFYRVLREYGFGDAEFRSFVKTKNVMPSDEFKKMLSQRRSRIQSYSKITKAVHEKQNRQSWDKKYESKHKSAITEFRQQEKANTISVWICSGCGKYFRHKPKAGCHKCNSLWFELTSVPRKAKKQGHHQRIEAA